MAILNGFDKIFVFIMGLIIGSFLNVCIHRMPKNESTVFPSSHCPECRKSLNWYDNIPVVSYIILRGRCRFCNKNISIIYPVVEILNALLTLLLYINFHLTPIFFIYSVLTSALIVVTFIDIATHEIPNSITLGGIIFGLIASVIFPSILGASSIAMGLLYSFLGIIAGGGSIYAMGVLGKLLFKKEAMGGGDVKLMAMVGSVIGWKLALLAFFIAPFFGVIVGVVLKLKKGHDSIAYGPYLAIATIIAVFFGEKILNLLFYGTQLN